MATACKLAAAANKGSILNSISLNASRDRLSELLSDFKKLSVDTAATKTKLSAESVSLDTGNETAENEESLEMVENYQQPSQEKLTALYVGDLHPSVTEEKLYHFFSKYNSLSTVKICTVPGTKTPLGYGYVNFSSEKEALKAMEDLNYTNLLGKDVRIMISMKGKNKAFLGTNVFISNLNTAKIPSSRAFYECFRDNGTIVSCKLDKIKHQGFISFENEQSAIKFIAKFDGTELYGSTIHCGAHIPKAIRSRTYNKFRPVSSATSAAPSTASTVKPYEPPRARLQSPRRLTIPQKAATSPTRILSDLSSASTVYSTNSAFDLASLPLSSAATSTAPSPDILTYKQVYLKGLAEDTTENDLRTLVTPCGEVHDIFLKSVPEFKSAWAIVTFASPESGHHATQTLHRLVFRGRKLTCVKALKKKERKEQVMFRGTPIYSAFIDKPSPHQKLYLYNLPQTVNENFFKLFMRGYTLKGRIIRFFISPKSQLSFIDFEYEVDATATCLRLNGIEVAGARITASLTPIDNFVPPEPVSSAPEAVMSPPERRVPAGNENLRRSASLMGNRHTSVTFTPQQSVIQDHRGGFFRLVPIPAGIPLPDYGSGPVNTLLSRSNSYRDIVEFGGGEYQDSHKKLTLSVETLAKQHIDFMKYPSATRSRNLTRIVQYFMDTQWKNDPATIKRNLKNLELHDAEAERVFKEKLTETIDLLGFSR